MKRIALAAMAACLLTGTGAMAAPVLHPVGGGAHGGPHGGPGGFHGGPGGFHGGPGFHGGGWGGQAHFGPVAYHRWGYGEVLPRAWFGPERFITDFAYYNLAAPPADYEWVRNGPDALLVNLDTGVVVNVVYGAFA